MALESPSNFTPAAIHPAHIEQEALWFVFHAQKLVVLVNDDHEPATLPRGKEVESLGITPIRTQMIGMLGDMICVAAETITIPDTFSAINLRKLYGKLDDAQFAVASRAIQLVDWERTHQFCGVCATAMMRHSDESAKICPNCDHRCYPRLAPAVIMAVVTQNHDRILLASNVRYRNQMYSVLAGFVDPGETLEQAVAREVKEEVGLDVADIRYFGSQPWPFPHSLMIAFTAVCIQGEQSDIVLQADELNDAQWFAADSLPLYPPQPSIANDLIMWFIEQNQ